MTELLFTIMGGLVVLGLFSLVLLIGILVVPYKGLEVVWCPGIKSVSFVETSSTRDNRGSVAVKNCLLWPDLGGCKQHCVKSELKNSRPPFESLRARPELDEGTNG